MASNDSSANSVKASESKETEVEVRAPSPANQKTFVSILHELCTKFEFGLAMYNLDRQIGDAHSQTFEMTLTVSLLDLTKVGSGTTKMKAKHDAAHQLMLEIKKTAREGGTLKEVSKEKLMACCEWMKKYPTLNEENVPLPAAAEPTNASGILTSWLLTRHQSLPVYRVLKTTGPSHARIFYMSCKLDQHVTEGEGKSKKVAKNVAAEKMLTILRSED